MRSQSLEGNYLFKRLHTFKVRASSAFSQGILRSSLRSAGLAQFGRKK